jgi:tRNA(adenine34) deaminase
MAPVDELVVHSDDEAMHLALEEARAAIAHDDVPVGAVVVHDHRVIARAHNERELRQDPTAHAELLALRAAAVLLGSWRLEKCTLYVTLEPCAMCAGALVGARIEGLVFGARDLKAGACGSLYNVVDDPRLNHQLEVVEGTLEPECSEILTSFFAARRPGTT